MRALLRNRNFTLLWLAQTVSTVGDVLYRVAVMAMVFERTGSALQTVGVSLATTLPSFLLGPIAGVLVDRFPRKWVMVTMDLLRAALVGLLLFVVRGQDIDVWGIYAVVAGLAVATTFFDPAGRAIIPGVVSKDRLVRANSWLMTSNQATRAVGYAVGGILFLVLGFRTVVVIDLATFVFAALAVAAISPPRPRRTSASRGRLLMWQGISDGVAYLRNHPLARSLTTMEILENVPHAIWTPALMLVFTEQVLQSNADGWGYQISAFNFGQLVGATLATVLAAQLARRPGRVVIWNAFIFGFLTIAYALSPELVTAVVLCFLFGPSSAMRDVAQDSLLQASVREAVLGRVYAMRTTFAQLSFTVGSLAFGWMADQTSARWVYLIGGLLYLGTAVYALLSEAIRESVIDAPTAVGSSG